MKISEIIFEMKPWYQPHHIELRCSMKVNGKELHWKEIFEDDDFENRFSRYIDIMKARILEAITEK